MPDRKFHSTGKDLDAGKDWRQKEKREAGWDGQIASSTQRTWIWANHEMVKDMEAQCAVIHRVAQSRTWLSDWTVTGCSIPDGWMCQWEQTNAWMMNGWSIPAPSLCYMFHSCSMAPEWAMTWEGWVPDAEGPGLGPRVVCELLPVALKSRSAHGPPGCSLRAPASQRGLCAAAPQAAWTFALNPAQTTAPVSFSGPPGTHQK